VAVLKTDPKRRGRDRNRCGIDVYVPDSGLVDAGCLDAPSFLKWLRIRGGYNPWAEQLCMRLLGYEDELPNIGTDLHESAMAGLAIAAGGMYDWSIVLHINGVSRSQHQAELTALGYDRNDNDFTWAP
jgi:hypothetical protein